MDSLKITKRSIFDLYLRLCEKSCKPSNCSGLFVASYDYKIEIISVHINTTQQIEDEFELSNCCYKDDIELSIFQNFVFLLTIDVSVFYISYPICVDIIQWQTDIIPTEYWESNI